MPLWHPDLDFVCQLEKTVPDAAITPYTQQPTGSFDSTLQIRVIRLQSFQEATDQKLMK